MDRRSRPGTASRVLAYALLATRLVDRGYGWFSRARSRLALRFGSEWFFQAYNGVAFSADAAYQPQAPRFRRDLFDFERRMIAQWFPPAPASVLVGGAGGGREAFALAALGYRVVAFDPTRDLVRAMLNAREGLEIEGLVGRYEDLPRVESLDGAPVDLSQRAPFDGAVFGWASLSHVWTDAARIEALRSVSQMTTGPMLVSYLPRPNQADNGAPGRDVFSIAIGRYRELTGNEVRVLAAAAGLSVTFLDDLHNWPHAILHHR